VRNRLPWAGAARGRWTGWSTMNPVAATTTATASFCPRIQRPMALCEGILRRLQDVPPSCTAAVAAYASSV